MRGIALTLGLVLPWGCAAVDAVEVREPTPAEEAVVVPEEGHDLAARVVAPARCEQAARAWLPAAPDEAWRGLWCCVQAGRFTALRELLGADWDPLLRARHDAPLLLARVIAERGGDVEADLALLQAHHIPIFSLAQALARGGVGTVVMARGRVAPSGLVEETHLVSQWRRNVDVPTGRRVLATGNDLLADSGESMVLFGRYDGVRDSDGWPELHVVSREWPSPLLSY